MNKCSWKIDVLVLLGRQNFSLNFYVTYTWISLGTVPFTEVQPRHICIDLLTRRCNLAPRVGSVPFTKKKKKIHKKAHRGARARIYGDPRIIFVRWGKMAGGRNAPQIDRANGCFARPRGRGEYCRVSGSPGLRHWPRNFHHERGRGQEVVTDSIYEWLMIWSILHDYLVDYNRCFIEHGVYSWWIGCFTLNW